MAFPIDEKGHGEGIGTIGRGRLRSGVVKHREGVALLLNEAGRRIHRLPAAVGGVDHQELDLIPQLLIGRVEVGHFALAGWAPTGPEVEDHRLTRVVGQAYRIPLPVIHREVGRVHRLLGCGRLRPSGALCSRQLPGGPAASQQPVENCSPDHHNQEDQRHHHDHFFRFHTGPSSQLSRVSSRPSVPVAMSTPTRMRNPPHTRLMVR